MRSPGISRIVACFGLFTIFAKWIMTCSEVIARIWFLKLVQYAMLVQGWAV